MTPRPSQLMTWMSWNLATGTEATDDPQFLRALRDTRAGDRQLVWEGGGGGRGVIAVVDFSHEQMHANGHWFSWGRTAMLDEPIGRDALATIPVLNERFFGAKRSSLQGHPIRLPEREAAAIDQLAGALPPSSPPNRPPRAGEPLGRWFGKLGIDPEKTFELAVHTSRHLWRAIGFVEAPTLQQRLSAPGTRTDIPDLYTPGLIGEVKRAVKANDGPDQAARYLKRLEEDQPELGPWRAVLIQGHPSLNPAAQRRLEELALPIEVWAVLEGTIRRWKAARIYPTVRRRRNQR